MSDAPLTEEDKALIAMVQRCIARLQEPHRAPGSAGALTRCFGTVYQEPVIQADIWQEGMELPPEVPVSGDNPSQMGGGCDPEEYPPGAIVYDDDDPDGHTGRVVSGSPKLQL